MYGIKKTLVRVARLVVSVCGCIGLSVYLLFGAGFVWISVGSVNSVFASSYPDVVINEIAWAGSVDNSNDEWIELYNNTSEKIDLSGWYIEDDGSTVYEIIDGEIEGHGYFLIEDREEAVDISADAVIGLSFANSGDGLILKNVDGSSIDIVNEDGGEWFSGDSDNKSSMERIDPRSSGDDKGNWASCVSGNGSKGVDGGEILGTPKSSNSNYAGGIEVGMEYEVAGEFLEVSVRSEMADLYAYGMEIQYDDEIFEFVDANESEFLKSDGEETSFFVALENDEAGKLVVGNARLGESSINGEGELFNIKFRILDLFDGTELVFGGENFLADRNGDLEARFEALTFGDSGEEGADLNDFDGGGSASQVESLEINLGEKRFSLSLGWEEPENGADSYVILRMMPDGNFVTIGEVEDLIFSDDDSVANGGKMVANVTYTYRVIPLSGGSYGEGFEISGTETRGLSGDNNRSDRVDGRDLMNLAKIYGSSYGETEYNLLIDSNYDGLIDGSDLIDIGANFGLKY